MKAIAIASAQGQRIYTLNAQNQASHAMILANMTISQEVKDEIAAALAAGLEVTTHEARISAYGFTGSGYIILDPDTGTGAYKIEGGGNGALLEASQGLLALVAIAQLVRTLALAQKLLLLGPILVASTVSPFVLLFAGLVALAAVFASGGNPYQDTRVSTDLLLIVTLTTIGPAAFAAWPILFAIVYFALLVVIARIAYELVILFSGRSKIDPRTRHADKDAREYVTA